jgi:hypothetical protein
MTSSPRKVLYPNANYPIAVIAIKGKCHGVLILVSESVGANAGAGGGVEWVHELVIYRWQPESKVVCHGLIC